MGIFLALHKLQYKLWALKNQSTTYNKIAIVASNQFLTQLEYSSR